MQLLFAEQCFPRPISTSPKALWRACQENPWRWEQPVHQRAHYVCLNAACKGTSVEQISAGIDATLKSRKSLQNAKDLAVWAVTKPRGTLQTAGVLSLKSPVQLSLLLSWNSCVWALCVSAAEFCARVPRRTANKPRQTALFQPLHITRIGQKMIIKAGM